MESVAVMAVSPYLPPSTDASTQSNGESPKRRRAMLASVLETKLRLGYELVSETEFGAVVCSPSPRRWLWMRKGRENPHLTIAIDASGRAHLSKGEATAHDRLT